MNSTRVALFDAPVQAVEKGLIGAIDAHDDSAVSETSLARRVTTAARAPGSPELPLPVLEARITELAGHLNAAGHRVLVLLAEFDRREGWSDGATRP